MSRWTVKKAVRRLDKLGWLCKVGPNKDQVREVFDIAAFLLGEVDRLQNGKEQNWAEKVNK